MYPSKQMEPDFGINSANETVHNADSISITAENWKRKCHKGSMLFTSILLDFVQYVGTASCDTLCISCTTDQMFTT